MDDINTVDFVEARSLEIQCIEESINKSNKKTMLFQRLPFYKRRRNRNYDKKVKKFTYRKRDRHFLRTHNFYAKRFFMLKLEKTSIPITRRIKSSKFIYKSKDRGFLFDESFRGVFEYNLVDIESYDNKNICDDVVDQLLINSPLGVDEITVEKLRSLVDFTLLNKVQRFNNEYEVVVAERSIILVGKSISRLIPANFYSALSIINNNNLDLKNITINYNGRFKTNIICFSSDGIETNKILCLRQEVMNFWQFLISNKIIPICLNEIHRIYFESDQMSIYDNIKSNLFEKIEHKVNESIIMKYERTPISKRVSFDTGKLFLSG